MKNKFPNSTKQQALHAAQCLVDAYKDGENNGGSVRWEDIDIAYEAAVQALKQERHELRGRNK